MTKAELGNLEGEFTWLFGQKVFIETPKGNFIWSAPNYGGSGEIREYEGGFVEYVEESGARRGRIKGKHVISDYCGDFVYPQ